MKIKTPILALAVVSAMSALGAVKTVSPVISDLNMQRIEGHPGALLVSYTIDGVEGKLPSNAEVVITPVVHFAGDSIELTPTTLSGRAAYLAHKRNHNLPAGTDIIRVKGGTPAQREALVTWSDDMMQSELTFRATTIGCRCKCEDITILPVRYAADFNPRQYELIIPRDQLAALEQNIQQVVKTRSVTKSAHVNYEVGSIKLLPNFENNPAELATILATIDSVRNDKDLTIDKVHIHGFASPEGTYRLNTRLSEGRTAALRNYVETRYNFGDKLSTASTPEDWDGLREWVENSSLHDKNAILRVINSNLAPDAKDEALQDRFPNAYKILLWEVYPTLRRADYTIEYTVCNYTKPETIAELLKTAPQKLSYEEIMLLARTYPVGSKERADLALRAAQMFPNDKRAQLAGAFVALERQDLDAAASMLDHADESPLADYGRGVLAIYRNDKANALNYLHKAAEAKIEGAAEALDYAEYMK